MLAQCIAGGIKRCTGAVIAPDMRPVGSYLDRQPDIIIDNQACAGRPTQAEQLGRLLMANQRRG